VVEGWGHSANRETRRMDLHHVNNALHNLSAAFKFSTFIVCCTTATRRDGNWILKFDDIEKSESVNSQVDVQLSNKEAFIGGRPGHEYLVYK